MDSFLQEQSLKGCEGYGRISRMKSKLAFEACLKSQQGYAFCAVPTGFEPAISALTGPHVKPLHHGTVLNSGQSLSYA